MPLRDPVSDIFLLEPDLIPKTAYRLCVRPVVRPRQRHELRIIGIEAPQGSHCVVIVRESEFCQRIRVKFFSFSGAGGQHDFTGVGLVPGYQAGPRRVGCCAGQGSQLRRHDAFRPILSTPGQRSAPMALMAAVRG